jgi:hypothetical protein
MSDGNEAQNPATADIPTTEKEFRKWRRKQGFTGDLADLAEFVESDMKLLAELDVIHATRPDLTHENTRAGIAERRTKFEEAYRKSFAADQ